MNRNFTSLLRTRLYRRSPSDDVQGCPAVAQKICREGSDKETTIARKTYEKAVRESKSGEEQALLNNIVRDVTEKKQNAEKPRKLSGMTNTDVVFVPIILNDPMCLSCHGSVGTEVLPPVVAALAEHSRSDGFSLLNKKMGDVLGFWILRRKIR